MIKWWNERAWDEYLFWQQQDKKTLKRINSLLKDVERNGYDCLGKPEPLKNKLSGWWSLRIDDKNRLIFRISKINEAEMLEIMACRGHYND